MTCHCRNASCWALQFLAIWVDQRFIYLMSRWCRLIGKPAPSWPQFSSVVRGTRVWPSPMTWIGSPPSLSGRCMLWNTGSLASPAVHGNCSAIWTCPASGILPPRIMNSESLGDSWTCLSINDYCQKIRVYKLLCRFPGWRINFSFWQELTWVGFVFNNVFHDHPGASSDNSGLVLLCFMVIIIYHFFGSLFD